MSHQTAWRYVWGHEGLSVEDQHTAAELAGLSDADRVGGQADHDVGDTLV
jgi:hypothetical protein